MPIGSTSVARSALVAGLVVAVMAGVTETADAGQVTRDHIAAAKAVESEAAAQLTSARDELASAVSLQQRLRVTVEALGSRRTEMGEAAADEATAVRDRLTRMYMAAGRPDVVLATAGDIGSFFTRLAYLGAVADRDRDTVISALVAVEDLAGLEQQATAQLEDLVSEISALEAAVASRTEALAEAADRTADLEDQWAQQEAARQAAIEAELRRQEEALARQATTTTTTTSPTATTTTVAGGFSADDGGYTYTPGGGVEQWRPLLTSVFARWGLDQEKCGPDGCVGSAIEGALTIMRCESSGVPFAVNPSSGTTGLFQHRPVFWSDRVARTRAKPWSNLPSDATPYNAAHNIEVAALLIWESRETLIGNLSYGRPWSDGPQPFGHWDSTSRYCADPPLVWP